MSDSVERYAALEQLTDALPECTDADGLHVRDQAGRVVATFATESGADALAALWDEIGSILEAWKSDLEELGELQASDEGHQEETEAAERERDEEKQRADKAETELQNALQEIEALKQQLPSARRERL